MHFWTDLQGFDVAPARGDTRGALAAVVAGRSGAGQTIRRLKAAAGYALHRQPTVAGSERNRGEIRRTQSGVRSSFGSKARANRATSLLTTTVHALVRSSGPHSATDRTLSISAARSTLGSSSPYRSCRPLSPCHSQRKRIELADAKFGAIARACLTISARFCVAKKMFTV